MKLFTIASALALSFAAWIGGAWAQIGLSEQECVDRWGSALEATNSEDGLRTVAFSNAGCRIEVGLIDGAVRRVCYRSATTSGRGAVQEILEANADGQTWNAWEDTRAGTNSPIRRRWMRADERAMAFEDEGAMTVVAAEWNLRKPNASGHSETGAVRSVPVSRVDETARPASTNEVVVAEPAPPAAPTRPDRLPAEGDSRQKVVEMLGPEKGTMRLGNREILAYPWGQVWLVEGKVVGVK
jgi:hypothetical protein